MIATTLSAVRGQEEDSPVWSLDDLTLFYQRFLYNKLNESIAPLSTNFITRVMVSSRPLHRKDLSYDAIYISVSVHRTK